MRASVSVCSASSRTRSIQRRNRDTRDFLAFLLTRKGYDVRTARDGAEALAVARDEPPRLFLLDHQMPDMTGIELLERIRGDAALAGSTAIFYSAAFERDVVRRAMDLGAQEWLVKGVHGVDHVTAAVARAFLQC